MGNKVLVIRKPDRTIHKVPLSNKAILLNYNQRLPLASRWKFEEMDEDEAAKLPFIDNSYISAAEAQSKVKELEGAASEKDKRIAELERMLAEKNAGIDSTTPGANGSSFNEPPLFNTDLTPNRELVNNQPNEQSDSVNQLKAGPVDAASKSAKTTKAKP